MGKNKLKEGTQANPIALLCSYRTQLMGIDTLMIIICHTYKTIFSSHKYHYPKAYRLRNIW